MLWKTEKEPEIHQIKFDESFRGKTKGELVDVFKVNGFTRDTKVMVRDESINGRLSVTLESFGEVSNSATYQGRGNKVVSKRGERKGIYHSFDSL